MRKKGKIACFLLSAMMLTTIAGCGKTEKEGSLIVSEESGETNVSQNESEEVIDYSDPLLQGLKKEEEKERNVNYAPYEYEQELQILDDAYRNYYEIFVASFYDSDGDGMGDLQGVIEKLDYLNDGDDTTDTDLGVNGIWLMPIMPSPTYHKYDVTDYYAIDSVYGTLDDFKQLIEECHERDIHVVIDFVMNHTSSGHEWFQQACQYLEALPEGEKPNEVECPYVDYYYFVNGESAPSSSYYQIGKSNWYYEGKFWSEMPDLDLSNENVRNEFEEIASYWIDLGVDGFRLDAVKEYVSGSITANVEILKWFTDYVHAYRDDIYVVGEVWEGMSTIAQYYGGGLDSAFNFSCAENDGILAKAAKGKYSMKTFGENMIHMKEQIAEYNPLGIDAPFLANHDTARLSNVLIHDEDQMKMAAGLMFTMNGSPFIYYGEEIGMASKGSKDENKRLPFIWSATNMEGMTEPPKDADQDITSYFAPLDEQMEDPTSLYHYYKRGIRLRNENPEIARGDVEIVDLGLSDKALAITKTYEGSVIGILYNNEEDSMEIELAGSVMEEMELRGYLTVDGSAVTMDGTKVILPEKSIAIIK